MNTVFSAGRRIVNRSDDEESGFLRVERPRHRHGARIGIGKNRNDMICVIPDQARRAERVHQFGLTVGRCSGTVDVAAVGSVKRGSACDLHIVIAGKRVEHDGVDQRQFTRLEPDSAGFIVGNGGIRHQEVPFAGTRIGNTGNDAPAAVPGNGGVDNRQPSRHVCGLDAVHAARDGAVDHFHGSVIQNCRAARSGDIGIASAFPFIIAGIVVSVINSQLSAGFHLDRIRCVCADHREVHQTQFR